MTIIATWFRQKEHSIYCVGDSRISRDGRRSSDSGAKVFPVSISTFKFENNKFTTPRESFTIGFAYAGNAVTAVSAYAMLSSLVQNLSIVNDSAPPPSILEVAQLGQVISEHCIKDAAGRYADNQDGMKYCSFCAHIFGWCRNNAKYVGFRLTPDLN